MQQLEERRAGNRIERRGTLIVEAMVAALLLGIAMSMLVPALTAISRQRQSARFETLAGIELNNLAGFLPDCQAATESEGPRFSDSPQLSGWFSSRYQDASLSVEFLPEAGSPPEAPLNAVRLTITRPQSEALPPQAVDLVVWVPGVEQVQ